MHEFTINRVFLYIEFVQMRAFMPGHDPNLDHWVFFWS